jgi:hypothetical protein
VTRRNNRKGTHSVKLAISSLVRDSSGGSSDSESSGGAVVVGAVNVSVAVEDASVVGVVTDLSANVVVDVVRALGGIADGY